MNIKPSPAPKVSCGLDPGTRLVVVGPFEICGRRFIQGEVLVFKHEMHDAERGCDAYVFGTPDSIKRERELPEPISIEDYIQWLALCPERRIVRESDREQPSVWLPYFQKTDDPVPDNGAGAGS